MRRALFGRAVGSSLLASALNRQRVETKKKRLNPVRVGLIRLCVNDLIRNNEKKGESLMTEALDEGQKKPAYICGRMLAVFEELQYAAQGDLNVNIVERYYALASTSPQIAFPKLETLSQAHLKKLKRENRGAAVAIERKLQELHDILAHQGATFPAQLSLENQGRFAIGYHHQKAMAQSRIKEAKERKAAEAAEKESTE
jgi:CRISPR-associated protein Csd1